MLPAYEVHPGPLAKAEEDDEVEEVHATKDEGDDADFDAQELKCGGKVGQVSAFFLEGEGDVSHIDEIKTDDQKFIYGICDADIVMKNVEEEDPSVLEKNPGHPNGEANADEKIKQVADY